MKSGQPERLLYGIDYAGLTCGVDNSVRCHPCATALQALPGTAVVVVVVVVVVVDVDVDVVAFSTGWRTCLHIHLSSSVLTPPGSGLLFCRARRRMVSRGTSAT